jgi:superoxide dismutase, Cu-Zn family
MNPTRTSPLVFTPALFLLVGCPGEAPSGGKRATAALESRSGSTATGIASFAEMGTQVKLTLTISGATPGTHAAHLHDKPDCSSADATSAMGHWNPDMMAHGLPTAAPHHLGDCGNFTVEADGKGTLTITNDWTIGTGDPNDIMGHSIIVHASPDDGMTQMPPGNAGARVACGVIQ